VNTGLSCDENSRHSNAERYAARRMTAAEAEAFEDHSSRAPSARARCVWPRQSCGLPARRSRHEARREAALGRRSERQTGWQRCAPPHSGDARLADSCRDRRGGEPAMIAEADAPRSGTRRT